MKPEKSEKEKRIDQAIEQIETYLNSKIHNMKRH